MATINPVDVGSAPNDDTGDPLRTAYQKINGNEANLNSDKLEAPVALTEIQDIATARLLGRSTAGSGSTEELAEAAARAIVNSPAISSEDGLVGEMQIAVVATLPGTPDANTIYFVTT